MSIATYGELKTAVANWLHRTDLTAQIPDFIALCEADIRRDIRVREMEDSTSAALVSTLLAIPTGFLEPRMVRIDSKVVEYVTPRQFNPLRESTTLNYTLQGTNFVFQVSSGTAQINYYKALTAFGADADTNTLLTENPDLYLYGSLAWARTYTQGDPSQFRSLYTAARDRIRTTQRTAIGPLRVAVGGYNP
jgi:hypothetical protein